MLKRRNMIMTISLLGWLLVVHPVFAQTVRLAPKQRAGSLCSHWAPFWISIDLQSQETGHLEVEQQADLVITVVSPDGLERVLDEFDFGPESVTVIADAGGTYRVKVEPAQSGASPVTCSIFWESLRYSTPRDSQRVHAEDVATQSKQKARMAKADWQPTLDLMRTSLGLWTNLGDLDAIARTRLKTGDLYFNKGVWDSARSEYREAKRLCNAADHLRCYAEAVNNLGLTALNLADLDEAQSELVAARQAWETLQLPVMAGITSSNLGLLFWETGEWQSALDQYEIARKLFQNRNSLSVAKTLNNIGLVHMSMADYKTASNYFLKALRIVRRLSDAMPVSGRVQINLGRARMLRGKLDEALKDERFAVRLMKGSGDVNGLAEALNNLGQIQLRRSHFKESRGSLNRAFSLYESIHDESGLSSVLHYQGILSEKDGDFKAAIRQFQRALDIRINRGLRDDAGETLYQLAVAERATGEYEQSRHHIKDAVAEAQILRTNIGGEPFRRNYFAAKQKYSAFLIEGLLTDRSRDEDDAFLKEAFEACERTRARSLVDVLGEDRISLRGADASLLARQHMVERRLHFKSAQLASLGETSNDPATEVTLRREIGELLEQAAEVDSALQSKTPGYRDAVAPSIVTADEARGLLSENDLLFEYFLGEAHSFVWIIDRHKVRVAELLPRRHIERLARSVIALMTDIQGRMADPQKETAFQIARLQLAGALHLSLNQRADNSRTIIVPDGFLHRVPFAILPTHSRDHSQNRMGPPLGLMTEVVQVPSATVFRILRDRQQKAATLGSAVVFADPVFDSLDSRVKRDSPANKGDRRAIHPDMNLREPTGLPLSRLSFSQFEIETVEHLLPPTRRRIFRGFDATKPALFSSEVRSYPILLLSTHAFVDDVQPELSTVVLSMVDENGRRVDGLVHLYELYQLKLNSLVILSACETATGRVVNGEGLIGLSRGFLQAGAWGVLASPYRIDAEGSAFLMDAFLQQLLGPRSLSPSEALLEARRILARSTRWKDPYYWGSFALISGLSYIPPAL